MLKLKDELYDQIRDLKENKTQYNERIEVVKRADAQCEAKIEQLEIQEKAIIKKIKDLGVDPDDLKGTIIEVHDKIIQLGKKLDEILPDDEGTINIDRMGVNITHIEDKKIKYSDVDTTEVNKKVIESDNLEDLDEDELD